MYSLSGDCHEAKGGASSRLIHAFTLSVCCVVPVALCFQKFLLNSRISRHLAYMASTFNKKTRKRSQFSWYHRKPWVDLRPARRECDEPRDCSHHVERHDDRYFECDGHVDGTSEHTPKERQRDLELDVPEKNVPGKD